MTPQDLALGLHLLSATGNRTYWRILKHFPVLSSFWTAPIERWRALLDDDELAACLDYRANGEQGYWWERIQSERSRCAETDVRLLFPADEDYPPLLKEIHQAPSVLYVRGNAATLSLPQLAIVGSRKATPAGIRVCETLAETLARGGLTVTSGLALGIDAAAHRGALASTRRDGPTVAVFGAAVDVIYPRRHRELAQQILDSGGALVSTLALGTRAHRYHFPERNRIVSGLSMGALVVEAALKSGSLITARLAMEQGRDVFAVPGSVFNPQAAGCHALIRQGATLVEKAEDVVQELAAMLDFVRDEASPPAAPLVNGIETGLEPGQARVLAQLGYDDRHPDALASELKIPVPELLSILLDLEVMGLVENRALGYIRVPGPG